MAINPPTRFSDQEPISSVASYYRVFRVRLPRSQLSIERHETEEANGAFIKSGGVEESKEIKVHTVLTYIRSVSVEARGCEPVVPVRVVQFVEVESTYQSLS